ncbi:MAG TPA: prepilin-type cleavage/methylation domain-containing protein [Janthinobacterium sp.]|nr:prepilin-type cleavage/methylation domain-containing protein [Janthinobacterium sp.]
MTQRGFSLVEMAIVLVIVGLMIGGLITPLGMQMQQRRIGDTQKALDEAKEALIGFALRYRYLPCPAISATNGLEDRGAQRCSNEKRQGFLPWATLGLPKSDSWNHLFRYSVTPAFSDSGAPFTLTSPRDISVATRDDAGRLTPATAANDIPAVILSHGKNGYGGTSEQGVRIANPSSTNADEALNAASATTFVSRSASDRRAAPGGEFDDIVVWLSPNILYNRMVTAQRLPQ